MEKSSFFNSVSHDRTYKAEDWAEYFASFIGNGVFPVPSTGLQVVANDGMKLNEEDLTFTDITRFVKSQRTTTRSMRFNCPSAVSSSTARSPVLK